MTDAEIAASMEAHSERNNALLIRFAQHGISADDHVDAEIHFWAPGPEAAAHLARELYSKGYLVLVVAPTAKDAQRWNVEAGLKRTISEMASTAMTENLVRTAAKFDATYDGWGASIPAKRGVQ